MNKYLRHIIPFYLLLINLACEEETNWNIQETGSSFTIVDALITSENKAQEIRAYKSSTNINGIQTPVTGAEIFIWDGNSQYFFTEVDSVAGLYISDPFVAVTGIDYYLIINYEGTVDTAIANMAPISPVLDFTLEAKPNNLYKYIYPGSDYPAMTEVYYDWSDVPEYCDVYGSCSASETYYSINVVDAAKEFAPEKQEILFPNGTAIIQKKYSLSEEHQEFIRSLLYETEWRGGIFDIEQGNVKTNFRNGTKGWFGLCQVLSDTTILTN